MPSFLRRAEPGQRVLFVTKSMYGPALRGHPDIDRLYLLEDGEKRWIDTIETFDERGYVWGDVQLVSCRNLRDIPDGVPIPADAGPPPQP